MSKIAEGFNCKTCEKYHAFGLWVMAHWDEALNHTCDECGAKHLIRRGIVRLLKKGRKQKDAQQ